MMAPMSAMILAAGRGERLRPLTDHLPKPLIEVAGKPLIAHHLCALAAAGFERVVINVAWLADAIVEALGDGERFGLALAYSREPPGALDTGGGIRAALPLLGGAPFLVVNADVYTDLDFNRLHGCAPPQAGAHLLMVANPPHHADGDFGLNAGHVNLSRPRTTYAGIGVYDPALFAAHEPGRFPLVEVLRPAIAAGRVTGERHHGRWHDVGRPQALTALAEETGDGPD